MDCYKNTIGMDDLWANGGDQSSATVEGTSNKNKNKPRAASTHKYLKSKTIGDIAALSRHTRPTLRSRRHISKTGDGSPIKQTKNILGTLKNTWWALIKTDPRPENQKNKEPKQF